MKVRKITLIALFLFSILLSIKYTFSYFYDEQNVSSLFKTKKYDYQVDLDGGTIEGSASIENNSLVIKNPYKSGYIFSKWDINGSKYKAIYTNDFSSVNITSTIQDVLYENGLATFSYDVFINDVLVADDVTNYKNDGVINGSTIRVVVNERDGYNIKSEKDITYTVKDDLTINVSWYDDIAPTVTNIKIEPIEYVDAYYAYAVGWTVKVTVEGYDNGTGIKSYSQYIIFPIAPTRITKYSDQTHTYMAVKDLEKGRKWCGSITDNAGNSSSYICITYSYQ